MNCQVGSPIRKFMDQSLFSAPHDLSQSITSFIASYCQGIHQTPFSRVIGSRKRQTSYEAGRPWKLASTTTRFPNQKSYFSRLACARHSLTFPCGNAAWLVYLTWTTLPVSAGILKGIRGKGPSKSSLQPEGIRTKLRSPPTCGINSVVIVSLFTM